VKSRSDIAIIGAVVLNHKVRAGMAGRSADARGSFKSPSGDNESNRMGFCPIRKRPSYISCKRVHRVGELAPGKGLASSWLQTRRTRSWK
jgi:hypothetical protein